MPSKRAKSEARRRRGKIPYARGTSTPSIERAARLKRGYPLKDPETGEVFVGEGQYSGFFGNRAEYGRPSKKKKPSNTPNTKSKAASSDAIQAEERRKAERKMGIKRGRGRKASK